MLGKKTLATIGCLLLVLGSVSVQAENVATPQMEQRIARQREMMQKQYARMPAEQLAKRKAMLEARLEKTPEGPQKVRLQTELDVLNELAQ